MPGAGLAEEEQVGKTVAVRKIASMASYNVDYERDSSGWWVGSVREIKGCHTQGRTIGETRKRIREALELFVDDTNTATLVDHVTMPAAARKAVSAYTAARQKAEREQAHAFVAARKAVRQLAGGPLKLSRRDAGELLGLSGQRVHQLLESVGDTPRRYRSKPGLIGHTKRRQGRRD
jgi:predicted RNase H-like HicB family nuclease